MKSFPEITFDDLQNKIVGRIKSEINSYKKDYILNVNRDAFINKLFNKYLLEPLEIYKDSECFDEPLKGRFWKINKEGFLYEEYQYFYNISYKFSGSSLLLFLSGQDTLDETSSIVYISFKSNADDPTNVEKLKSKAYKKAFSNIEHINNCAKTFNNNLRKTIESIYELKKKKYEKEN